MLSLDRPNMNFGSCQGQVQQPVNITCGQKQPCSYKPQKLKNTDFLWGISKPPLLDFIGKGSAYISALASDGLFLHPALFLNPVANKKPSRELEPPKQIMGALYPKLQFQS